MSGDAISLSKLMLRAQNGDSDAMADLLRQSTYLLKSFFSKKGVSFHDIDDLVQDTLIGVHNSRHTFLAERPYVPWLFSIGHRKYCDYLSRKNRQGGHAADAEAYFDILADPKAQQFEGVVEGQELMAAIQTALDTLPPVQQQIITLLKLQHVKVTDIAQQLNMSPSAVKTTAHRGYKRARRYLEKYYGL